MQGPFITRRAYQYGHTFYEQEVPYYNSTAHHIQRDGFRGLCRACTFDDGNQYKPDTSKTTGNIIRGNVPNVINVETMIEKILKVYIYAVNEEEDTVHSLVLGNRYAITYMTEQGMRVADGYLRVISSSIPEECTKYIGQYTNAEAQGYIGIDCSMKGVSDKRKIYIASIRDIQCLPDDEDYKAPEKPEDQKKFDMLERLERLFEAMESCDCYAELSEDLDAIESKLNKIHEDRIMFTESVMANKKNEETQE